VKHALHEGLVDDIQAANHRIDQRLWGQLVDASWQAAAGVEDGGERLVAEELASDASALDMNA